MSVSYTVMAPFFFQNFYERSCYFLDYYILIFMKLSLPVLPSSFICFLWNYFFLIFIIYLILLSLN